MLIPSDYFDHDLLFWVREQRSKVDNTDSLESALLMFLECIAKISFDDSNHIHSSENIWTKRLTAQELCLIRTFHLCESDNLYVRAICLDLACKEDKDKREKSLKASDAYLDLFAKPNSQYPWFLIRSIEVRRIRSYYTDEYLERICGLLVHVYPVWMKRISELLFNSYTIDRLTCFISFLKDRLQHVDDEWHRDNERYVLDALYVVKSITKSEWHRGVALSYEKEVDYTNEHAKKNTVYPYLPGVALKALQAIHPVKKEFPEDFERIQQKLIEEQKKLSDVMSIIGIKVSLGLPVDKLEKMNKYVEQLEIKESVTMIKVLKDLPFPSSKFYLKHFNYLKENSFTAQYMGTVSVGGDGRILGTSNPEESTKIQVHKHLREVIMQFIASIFDSKAKYELHVDEDLLFNVLLTLPRASYVENDRFPLWVMGIIAGCRGDMITASHILIPQIEHALKIKLASYEECILKLQDEKHQDEYNLMGTLESLKDYFKEELYSEFYFFFNHGADENFRNRLSHGISSINEIKRLGIYTWWIAIKMFCCENEMFKQVNSDAK